MVNKNTVVGVDMERSIFRAVEARFLVRTHHAPFHNHKSHCCRSVAWYVQCLTWKLGASLSAAHLQRMSRF